MRLPSTDFAELANDISASADELEGDHSHAMRVAGLEKGSKLRGRRGPGGSPEVAHLCDDPRREVAKEALGIATALYYSPSHPDKTKCPVTGYGVFGPAFAALLSDHELFDRAGFIRARSNARFARIEWKHGSESWF